MTIPLHQYASVPVAAAATTVHDRLTTALTAWLVTTPAGRGRSRLALVSYRSPRGELATAPLDRLHRQRLTRIAVQTFLRALADRLHDEVAPTSATGRGTRHTDDSPTYLHDVVTLAAPVEDVVRQLLDDPLGRATRATDIAVAEAVSLLTAGAFRASADPRVAVRPATDDELGAVVVQWDDVEQRWPHLRREDATGWPTMTLTLAATPARRGSRLAVLSPREPGYDLSVNRVDKHVRDQLVRAAVTSFLTAIADELRPTVAPPTPEDTSAEPRVPVVTG